MKPGSYLRGNSPEAACQGKQAYATADKAHRTLARQKKRHGVKRASAGRGDTHIYRCHYCHQFHIGSTTL